MTEGARELDQSLVRGIAWTGVARWLAQFMSWGCTVITARHLSPADYGLFGMAMVCIGFGQIITEAGVTTAIVQRPKLTEAESAELSGVAVLLGFALAAAAIGAGAVIAQFYKEPFVRTLIVVLSTVFLIRSVQLVPRALLSRELRFQRLAVIDAGESIALVGSTLVFAIMGFGVWSLALGTLVGTLVGTMLVLRSRRVRVAIPTGRVRAPVLFTWQVTVSQVAWFVYTNADFAVIGRVLGTVALGGYTMAWNIANIAGERVTAIISRVTPPLFAAVQHDNAALRRYFSGLTEGIALITLPASVGLSLVASDLVPAVLGDKWAGAVAPLRLLGLYAAFRAMFYLAPQFLMATGRARKSMRIGLISAIVLPPSFLVGAKLGGVTGVATAWVIVYPALALATYVRETLILAELSWYSYIAALWPAIRGTLVMTATVFVARRLTPDAWTPRHALVVHALLGAVVYGAVIIIGLAGGRLRSLVMLARASLSKPQQAKKLVLRIDRPSERDRLLLITYHFPPSTAVGALRWQKLVRYGAERGWQFDVVALDPNSLANADRSLWGELPPGTRLFGVAPAKPFIERMAAVAGRAARRLHVTAAPGRRHESIARGDLRWWPRAPRDVLRSVFSYIEVIAQGRWEREATHLALELYRPGLHRAVITCGPPHMVHMAGRSVSRWTGLPHIMDMRDPWSFNQRIPEATASRLGVYLASRMERKAVASAALVVANTDAFRKAMADLYPQAAGKIITVQNGCDDDPIPTAHTEHRFIAAYAGTIYFDRDPRPLFQAVALFAREAMLEPSDFSLEFMGNVTHLDGIPIQQIAAEEGVSAFLRIHPPRPRSEALAFLSRASMLVVLHQDSDLAIPAKVFDYARFNAWLLALAGPTSAVATLLRGTDADCVNHDDVAAIASALRRRYQEFRAGKRATPLATIPQLSRRHQASILFDAIERRTGPPVPRAEGVLCAAS